MQVESMITATTPKPTPQAGGKYADHEFVKVASKVIKGVERAPYNKFETILVNYDKMKEIKGKRNLTKSEQRIYDTTDKLIQKEFDAMFKKADTMLDQLDRTTPSQKGGGRDHDAADAVPEIVSPATEEVPPKDPASTDSTTTTTTAKSKEDPAIKRMRDDSTGSNASVTVPEYKELPPRKDNGDDTPAAAVAAADASPSPTDEGGEGNKTTMYRDSNRFYRWIVSLLEGIWKWIKDLFTGAFNEKFEGLRKQFSADELFKLFGKDHEKMDAATEALRVQAEKIQRLVATGIGGAASASIDMILNAFSMSPVFGTTILVWRMFQNMLMIMGASLSVQAASNSGATTLATIANPKLAAEPPSKGGGVKTKSNAKNNVTKRLKTDIRQLNRSLKRYMHFPHNRKGTTGTTMSGSGAGSGYSYT